VYWGAGIIVVLTGEMPSTKMWVWEIGWQQVSGEMGHLLFTKKRYQNALRIVTAI
jgi:hypothetical protein